MANRPKLSFERDREIAALAERVRGTRFSDQPVDPEQIAKDENISFCYASFPEDFDGVLIHENGRFFIVCNDQASPRGSARSRFTFSHELGHYFLHRETLVGMGGTAYYSRADFVSNDPLEVEADVFAANLLLPEKAFLAQAAARSGSGLGRIESIATYFGTSLTATAYRGIDLDLFTAPAAVFRWDVAGALVSRRMSNRTTRLGYEFLGLASQPPAGSVTERCVATSSEGSDSGKSHLMDWFPKLSGFGQGDQRFVREEVKSLGQYGYLTLIFAEA